MSSTPPSDRPFAQSGVGRQSALSAQREPFVPPRAVLDQVSGRVLDPGTALAVKGVRPRSTLYVGPRLIVCRDTRHRRGDPAPPGGRGRRSGGTRRCTSSDRDRASSGDAPGSRAWSASTSPCRDEKATLAPDGWVLLQNARAKYGIDAMQRVGLDHIVLLRSIGANPFHQRQPVPQASPFHQRQPGRRHRLGRRLVVRRPGLRVGASRSRTPGRPRFAATTKLITRSAPGRGHARHRLRQARLAQGRGDQGPGIDGGADRLHRRPDRPGEVVRPGRRPRRQHRPARRARHVHRRTDPPGLPRRRHRRLADRRLGRAGRGERHGQGAPRHRRAGAAPPRRRARRAGDRRVQPVDGLLPRDAGGPPLRPDDVRHPQAHGRVRRRGRLLRRQRRDRSADVPRCVRAVGRRQGRRTLRPPTWSRSSPSAR